MKSKGITHTAYLGEIQVESQFSDIMVFTSMEKTKNHAQEPFFALFPFLFSSNNPFSPYTNWCIKKLTKATSHLLSHESSILDRKKKIAPLPKKSLLSKIYYS